MPVFREVDILIYECVLTELMAPPVFKLSLKMDLQNPPPQGQTQFFQVREQKPSSAMHHESSGCSMGFHGSIIFVHEASCVLSMHHGSVPKQFSWHQGIASVSHVEVIEWPLASWQFDCRFKRKAWCMLKLSMINHIKRRALLTH